MATPTAPTALPAPLYTIATDGQLHPHIEREYLLTNNLGSYAASTILGCNTRRYHGLLVAAAHPPLNRLVTLSRVGEILYLDGDTTTLHELSINSFRSHFHPRGDRLLRSFTLDSSSTTAEGMRAPDTASWQFEVDGISITKTLRLLHQKNEIELVYALSSPAARKVELRLLPFVALRDFHSLRHGRYELRTTVGNSSVTLSDGQNTLAMSSPSAAFTGAPDFWTNHHYPIETERGQDDSEDLITPGYFSVVLNTTASVAEVVLRATLTSPAFSPPPALEPARLSGGATATVRRLIAASDAFIAHRTTPEGKPGATVMAGYPWFSDWGRDTMISLPGLLLATGRFGVARDVLATFAAHVSQGMIPNRFDDYTHEPEFNTVDASLWFIHASYEYAKASGDKAFFAERLLPACKAIVAGYRAGTRFGIAVDPADGLVTQGDANTQLTWMDAKCNDVAFTPRQGKPVEINALWYHCLSIMGESAEAKRVGESFRAAFVRGDGQGLYDVVRAGYADAAIRPNQIYAASLAYSPLTPAQARTVVDTVRRHLLTPVGLRSLAPSDAGYRPHYSGPQYQRDSAYHNGTVWGYLIGAFLDAHLAVHNDSPHARTHARTWLQPMLDHLTATGCVGSLSEIFEADVPPTTTHRPVGCFAQAWTVAETLRLALRLGM